MAPLAKQDEAAAILATLQWAASPVSAWHAVSRAFVTSFAVMFVPAALAALAVIPFLGPVAVLWLLGAAVAVAARWFNWRRTRYVLDEGTLFVATGWWRHRLSILPQANIQSIDITENFWSRAFGTCTVRLGVAGGRGFSDHHIPALGRPDADSLRARLLAE